MLADDVVAYGDGGGKAPQWSMPIVDVDQVAPRTGSPVPCYVGG